MPGQGTLSRQIKSDDIPTGTVQPTHQTVITQDGTFQPTPAGSYWKAFPVPFSVAPRAVMVNPGPGAANVNVRVTRINAGSFAAIGTPINKVCYFSAKGSR